MVIIKARTHTLGTKVPVRWNNNLGKKIVPITQRHLKNTKGEKMHHLWAITVIYFIQQKHVFN